MRSNIHLLYEAVEPRISDIYQWAKDGVSKDAMATRLGITRGQLYDLRKKYLNIKLATDGRKEEEQPYEYDPRQNEAYIELAGAIIRRVLNDYIRACYYNLKSQAYITLSGDPNLVSTHKIISKSEEFMNSGWFELLSLSTVSKDYLIDFAKKEAEFMYYIEDKIKNMDEEQIKMIIKLCEQEIANRKQKEGK